MKSISDASVLAWENTAELIDIEMKCMKEKWNDWREICDE